MLVPQGPLRLLNLSAGERNKRMTEFDQCIVPGPRLLLELEKPKDLDAERAAAANLVIVRNPGSAPKPTMGKVLKMGTDPLFQEWGIKVGSRVSFAHSAGDRIFLDGQEYRMIEYQEIKLILPPAPQVTSSEGSGSPQI